LTLIIGYRHKDNIILTADTKVTDIKEGKICGSGNARKIRLVYPYCAIASAGIVTDGTNASIRTCLQTSINNSASIIMECTKDYYKTNYETYKKYNESVIESSEFIVGGIDCESDQPFLYKGSSKTQFNYVSRDLLIIGDKQQEVQKHLDQIFPKQNLNLSINDYIVVFTETIRKFAEISPFIGKETLTQVIEKKRCYEIYLDANGIQQNPPFKTFT
jgi:20S proteasome alpha/beta subunit